MTGSAVSSAVEWARWGMDPDTRGGYHVLACSKGRFSRDNFKEILDRFNPGTIDELPQVTVSYVRAGDGSRFLGMAIHEAEVSWAGRLGRDATATRYFCVPYPEAAAAAVPYVAMYEAFRDIRLAEDDRLVRTVELAGAAAEVPADGERALPVVGLLLTGNPVCIVGAEGTEVADRLAYIDAVMSLLPYGMRAEMAASTWTRGTYRGHRFRLFFSDAPRRPVESGIDDHVVRWHSGHVEVVRAPVTRFPAEPAAEYLNLLRQQLDPPTLSRMASDTEPAQYNAEAGLRSLRQLGVPHADGTSPTDATREPRPYQWRAKKMKRPPGTGRGPRAPKSAAARRVEELLLACVLAVDEGSRNVKQNVSQLEELLETAETPDAVQRQRLHDVFGTSPRLMRVLPMGKQRVSLYQFLARLALSRAIDYQAYCLIEDILGGPPERALLAAVAERAANDPVVKLLVSLQRDEQRRAGRLRPLTEVAADPGLRPAHARIICHHLLDGLQAATASDIEDALPLLRQYGYLAPALSEREPQDLQYQVDVLTSLLAALVPESPGGDDPYQGFLAGAGGQPPTVALLLAVLCLTSESPAKAGASFIAGLARAPGLGDDVRHALAVKGIEVDATEDSAPPGRPAGADFTAPFMSKRRDSNRATRGVRPWLLIPRSTLSPDQPENPEGEED